MSDNTDYIRETLYPALYKNLDKVFPEMEFKKRSTRWISSHYLNGEKTKGQHYQSDKTWVGERYISNLCENGSGDKIDLLTFYMEQNGVTNLYEAERQIAKIVNVSDPPESEESKAKAKADKEKAEILFLSYERQKKALFSPEGAEVLRYLKEDRGYPEDLIRKMGLGYLSEKEGLFLEQRLQIGYSQYFKDFPLSIPYFSKGSLLGFKLRYISKEAKQKYGKGKYRNPTAFDGIMNYNPFNLPPFRVNSGTKKERTVIVVEGELDALHAREKGIENIIAASGGNGISKEKANVIADWGYNSVILTLDTDKAGQKQTIDSIEILLNRGIKVYVATLPDGKDTDEFLKTHEAEEYKAVIENCTQAVYYLFKKEVDAFNSTARTPMDFDKFQDKVIELSLKTKDEVLRGRILDSLKDAFGVSGEEAYKGYRAKADRLKAEQEKKAALQKSDEALKEATRLLGIGDKEGARVNTKEALDKLKAAEGEDKYSYLLRDNTDELWERYKNPPKTFDTAFILSVALKTKKGEKEIIPYRLSFPSGAISVIGAFTNHGKSKILQSIALDGLKADWEDGVILYFTYEENEENVNIQFLNAYTDTELTKKAKNIPNAGNYRTIKDYLFNGDTTFFKKEKDTNGLTPLEIFKKAEEEWKNIRKEGKIRIIKPESNTLEELIDILRYAKEHLPIRAVFLDYIQELYLDDSKRIGSRPDELKKIMVDLDLFAQEANIPIIAAAQLGRAVGGPGGLCNQIISDSGWIERKASEIVLIWSSNGEKDKDSGDLKKLTEIVGSQYAEIFQKEEEGYLFLKLTKSRTIPKGAKAVVEIHGNSGRVQRNGDLPKPPEARQTEIGYSDSEVRIDPEAQRPYRRSREEETETPATYTGSNTDEASRNSGGNISIEEPPIDPFAPFPPPEENDIELPF